MSLSGKFAVVTGAARGIGRACALALADDGAHVVAVDRDPCDDTREEIISAGGSASSAASRSPTAGSGSMSTHTSSRASSAMYRLVATTAAMGSP